MVTCGSSLLARYAVPEVAALTGKPVQLLTGGTLAWIAAGLPLAHGDSGLAVERRDRYRRPYEGTDNSARPCRPIWSGSMAWWISWPATAPTVFGCSSASPPQASRMIHEY